MVCVKKREALYPKLAREALLSATTGEQAQDGSQLRDALTVFSLGTCKVACLDRPFFCDDSDLGQDYVFNYLKLTFFTICDAMETMVELPAF